ncbi:MAG TPA: response regulator [Croceibacterium sp.]|jgi:CheY-like chemotaxis protein
MNDIQPILVVDDEPLVRIVLVDALQQCGYSVLEAENGRAALGVIDGAEQLRGLVTDIRLGPGATGWQIADHAREKFAGLAVIYVTGDSMADWTAKGVPRSFALQKPFASLEVVAALADLLAVQPSAPRPS